MSSLEQYRYSVAKQEKLSRVVSLLCPGDQLQGLAIGSGGGALTWMLREAVGGEWRAAEPSPQEVALTSRTLGRPADLVQGPLLPYPDDAFHRVVVFDYLEHVENDRLLVEELSRVLKPGGQLVAVVPLPPGPMVEKMRLALGQTDQRHGHVRPGYHRRSLGELLNSRFTVLGTQAYGWLFWDLLDNAARWWSDRKGKAPGEGVSPVVRSLFPLLKAVVRLDAILRPGPAHLQVVSAVVRKELHGPPPKTPQSTALVTGAAGFVGTHLVRSLLAAGCRVRMLVRTPTQAPEGAEVLVGQVWDEALLEEAARGVDTVYHLASSFRKASVGPHVHQRTHLEGTQAVARACVKQGVSRLVHVSTIGVHGAVPHRRADETTPFAPMDSYQRTKAMAEQWVRAFAVEHGLDLVVVRPAAIYGPGDRRLLKLARMARRGWMPWVGRGEGRLQFVHVQDLVEFLQLCARHPKAVGDVFICAEPESLPTRVLVAGLARAFGKTLRVLRLPLAPVMVAAVWCEKICRPFGLEPPLFPRRVGFFRHNRCFSTAKAREVLGFSTRISRDQGWLATLAWYAEHGWLDPP